jgi:hypothetical protein
MPNIASKWPLEGVFLFLHSWLIGESSLIQEGVLKQTGRISWWPRFDGGLTYGLWSLSLKDLWCVA